MRKISTTNSFIITILAFILLSPAVFGQANQCPGCLINAGCTITPAHPTLCPAVAPDGNQGQYYDNDLNFYMPAQYNDSATGLDVTLNQITIVNVTIPLGLYWTTSSANNIFYPTANPPTTEHGCVKLCGTPIAAGNFMIVVNVIANVNTIAGNSNQNSSFNVPITIIAATGGNSGFTFSPTTGCGTVDATFHGIITLPPHPATYNWTFGNGDTSTLMNPPVEHYSNPGSYQVVLQTQLLDYVLTDATFNATDDAWCGDVEEPYLFGCSGAPDLYFVLTMGSNVVTSTSGVDNTTQTWSGLGIVITNPLFTMNFWDEDVISANDDLGSFAYNVTGTGTFNFQTPHGNGSITIGTQVNSTFNDTDTVIVYPNPPVPIVSVFPNDSVCASDSITLTASSGPMYQWYRDTTAIVAANDSFYVTHLTGDYWVKVTDNNGCVSNSLPIHVTFIPMPLLPSMWITGDTLHNNSTGVALQWYFNWVPIPGATTNTYIYTQTGTYSISATNSFGCMTMSDSLQLIHSGAGISDLGEVRNYSVFPNPSNGTFNISFDVPIQSNLSISVKDVLGRELYHRDAGYFAGHYASSLELTGVGRGVYMMEVMVGKSKFGKRIVIE